MCGQPFVHKWSGATVWLRYSEPRVCMQWRRDHLGISEHQTSARHRFENDLQFLQFVPLLKWRANFWVTDSIYSDCSWMLERWELWWGPHMSTLRSWIPLVRWVRQAWLVRTMSWNWNMLRIELNSSFWWLLEIKPDEWELHRVFQPWCMPSW